MPDLSGSRRRRIGLVLGAGGQAGAMFHRGVVRAMAEAGLDARGAEVIVGTSAGSLVGASLCRHVPDRPVPGAPRGGRFAPRRLRMPDRASVLEMVRRPRDGINALLLRPEFTFGRLNLGGLLTGLREAYGSEWPAPLRVVAVRRADGRRVVFGQPGAPATDVASAVAASCAVPGYTDPVEIGGVAYVDGGVHSPTNADLLAGHDLDLVVVSSPMSVDLHASRPRVDLPIRYRFHRFLRSEVWTLRRHGRRVVAIEPDADTLEAMGLRMLNTAEPGQIEEAGYAHARRRLDVEGSLR
jgi:NTE family protein